MRNTRIKSAKSDVMLSSLIQVVLNSEFKTLIFQGQANNTLHNVTIDTQMFTHCVKPFVS